ncbi:hypothetical protein RHMOL_Rhmol01G0058500 [Rhododendron molle]|uniref:Uncharacterized protein n=1 Tax=Rhododendron molle TaxID=49168 RepID=A0ACC0PYC8_RHOML|nr:hypothetical protein RHMOL_Rhmol01G0058500 [Rhododendron molle]
MAGKTTLATIVLVVVASAALMEGAAAAVYVVGDATSWTIPSSAAFYSNWAANKNFTVGDILVFNFVTGAHDVATVTKTSYDSCSSASPIAIQTTGPANVTLTTGEHYFICTVGQHCANGQKLSVNVPAAAGSPTPTPSPSPSPASPTPTPSTTPSPTPSATPPPAPTPAAPTPSPTAHSPPPSPTPTNSPPPPPTTESPPSTSPTESTSPPPPPPPSSAPRKAVAAFGMVVMSIAIGALF